MSRASNSLKATDVTATPIKLKYSASYSDTTICDSGIYAQTGINGPVTITGSIPEATLRYWSIRHLYYSNFLTGSYQTSGSSADNFLQSTAASGTFEGNTIASASADIRSFPTASGSKIKIINIPRSSFGEQVSKKSFFLTSDDGTSYQLVDDGNGNIIDTFNNDVHVGNIIYAQGFVIITNPAYYCAMDGGPTTFPKSYIFDIVDSPKTFTPILGAIPDCAPIVSSSLALQEYPYYLFPSNSISNTGLVTLNEADPLTNKLGTYKSFYTLESTYCATSDEQVIDVQIVDCTLRGLTLIEIAPSPSLTPTVSLTPTISATPTISLTPTISTTPTLSITPTVSLTPTISQTPTISASPGSSLTPTVSLTPTISQTPTISTTPTPTTSTQVGSVSITSNNQAQFPYPVTTGNASSSGTISNTIGVTVYVYIVFNSGGASSGNIGTDSGVIDGTSIPMSGTVTSSGQTIYSATYATIANGSTGLAWSLSKQDGIGSGSTLRLGYSTTPGGSITLLAL